MKVSRTQPQAAFTMVEIAISLAVIGFALVAIIGVLPRGLRVQRENREETIINQDAAVFLSALRNGARGMDDLINYVYEVRRYTQQFDAATNAVGTIVTNSYTYTSSTTTPPFPILNGARIVGLLSWPKYEANPAGGGFLSNYVVASVRAISGPASEKPPQNNAGVQADAFSYQMICENLPVAAYDANTPYGRQLTNNLHELRLTFRWPLLPTGNPPINGPRQTFRTQIGGRLLLTNDILVTSHSLFFFEPQTFAQPLP